LILAKISNFFIIKNQVIKFTFEISTHDIII
jgi:hypothetical protein